jgi:hypothetical protein
MVKTIEHLFTEHVLTGNDPACGVCPGIPNRIARQHRRNPKVPAVRAVDLIDSDDLVPAPELATLFQLPETIAGLGAQGAVITMAASTSRFMFWQVDREDRLRPF